MKLQNVPFLDLRRSLPDQREKVAQIIAGVLERGVYILGPELESFERELAASVGVPFAAGVGSGTDALILALEASGSVTPGSGDEILTSAISAAFTALAICRAGAIPRFVDVDPLTLQIDAGRIEPSITGKTRAILPVHLYGNPCDIDQILDIAIRYQMTVIEDACQAHGSRLSGRALGSFGRAAAFSFYPTKNLGAFGDGGMVVSGDEALIRRVKMLRHGGQDSPYHHALLGCCSRLDEIQSALLRIRLQHLEPRNEIRRKLAARYDEAFSDLELQRLPALPDFIPNRHLYTVRTPRREELRRFLDENGVQTLVHYPIPLPDQPVFRHFVLPNQEFPVARKVAQEIFSLPLYPELGEDELQYTIQTMRKFFRA
jgi:dTDP-4-amino-4,6-dideoxygalactose transaminase